MDETVELFRIDVAHEDVLEEFPVLRLWALLGHPRQLGAAIVVVGLEAAEELDGLDHAVAAVDLHLEVAGIGGLVPAWTLILINNTHNSLRF